MWLTFISSKKEWHFFTVTEMFSAPAGVSGAVQKIGVLRGVGGRYLISPITLPAASQNQLPENRHPQNRPFSLIPPTPAHLNNDLPANRE